MSAAVTDARLMPYEHLAGPKPVSVGASRGWVGDPLSGGGLHQFAQHDASVCPSATIRDEDRFCRLRKRFATAYFGQAFWGEWALSLGKMVAEPPSPEQLRATFQGLLSLALTRDASLRALAVWDRTPSPPSM
jgi:hypothetical protein